MRWGLASSHMYLVLDLERMASICTKGDSAGCQEILQESGQVLEQLLGGGGVTDPGSAQETHRCCSHGHGFMGNIGGRWTVGSGDLTGPFQLW